MFLLTSFVINFHVLFISSKHDIKTYRWTIKIQIIIVHHFYKIIQKPIDALSMREKITFKMNFLFFISIEICLIKLVSKRECFLHYISVVFFTFKCKWNNTKMFKFIQIYPNLFHSLSHFEIQVVELFPLQKTFKPRLTYLNDNRFKIVNSS